MKTSTKIALVIAAVCILLGLILGCIAVYLYGVDFSKNDDLFFNNINLHTETFEVTEPIQNICVQDTECDIAILPSTDGKCWVSYTDSELFTHEISCSNGALRITSKQTGSWTDYLFVIYSGEVFIRIYLPENTYQQLDLDTTSGEISIPSGFTFDSAQLSTTSGDIDCASDVLHTLNISTTSGDVAVADLSAGPMNISCTSGYVSLSDIHGESLTVGTTSGDMEVANASVDGSFALSSTSGDMKVSNLSCYSMDLSCTSGAVSLRQVFASTLSAESTSGDLELKDVTISGHTNLGTTSGDVDLDNVESATLTASTASGEIEGFTPTPKNFSADTISGDIFLPNSDPGAGAWTFSTTSGDVEIRIS